jgi:hypothetical protein
MPVFERFQDVAPKTLDLERARKSLREELEAIDYYSERIDATDDEVLKTILAHNAAEEKEHAAMLYKWICENDPEQGEEAEELEGRSVMEAIESEED